MMPARCPTCGREFERAHLTPAGNIPGHAEGGWTACPGSYQPPRGAERPPAFMSWYCEGGK